MCYTVVHFDPLVSANWCSGVNGEEESRKGVDTESGHW